MHDDKIVYPNDDLADDMYNNIDHQTAKQKQKNHNSLTPLLTMKYNQVLI